MRCTLLTTIATLALSGAALSELENLRAGQMLPVDVPTGETFQRLTGPGPYFAYGIEADDGFKKQSVSFVVLPVDEKIGQVDVQIIDLPINRSILVDPEGAIDALGEGCLMVIDFEKSDSDLTTAAEEGGANQGEEPELEMHPVIYWPWWLVDYEDGSVGAEGTRLLCLFGFTSKYNNGKRMTAVLLDGTKGIIQHPLLPDGYLEITWEGRGYELEWGTDASGDEKLSVNGVEVTPDSEFHPRRWESLLQLKAKSRAFELLREHHRIKDSPTAKH